MRRKKEIDTHRINLEYLKSREAIKKKCNSMIEEIGKQNNRLANLKDKYLINTFNQRHLDELNALLVELKSDIMHAMRSTEPK